MQQIEKLNHGETSILGMEGHWVKLSENRGSVLICRLSVVLHYLKNETNLYRRNNAGHAR